MPSEPSILQKARYYSSVSGLYLGTLLFALYLINPVHFKNKSSPAIYSRAPLPQQIVAVPTAVSKPIISGKPVRIVINEADNGLNIDLPIDDGQYDTNSNSWTLSEQHAQFALPSVIANDTTGTTLIYGHNNKYVFGYLSAIHPNAGAYSQVFTDNGHVFTYVYSNVDSVKPDDTSVFNYKGKPMLTVQTCGGSFFEYRQLFHFNLQKVDERDV